MSNLAQKPLEFRHEDTQFIVVDPDGRNLGRIAYDLTAHRWEYNPYGESTKTVGTLEACKSAAEADYEEYLNQSIVIEIGTLAPTYALTRTSWRAVGAGRSAYVKVRTRDNEEYKVLVADSFVRRLKVGSVVQLRHRDGSLYLQWTRKPVRRCAISA